MGLDIPADFSGECVIFAAGTGILPFVDLLDFLLKKSIYILFKKKRMQNEKYQVKPVQDYTQFYPGAKFKLFAAFKSLEDFVGYNWIEKLYEINEEYSLGIFDCLVRFSDKSEMEVPMTSFYYDEEFVKRNILRADNPVDKVIVCGPPKFMEEITQSCLSQGFPSSKIHYI